MRTRQTSRMIRLKIEEDALPKSMLRSYVCFASIFWRSVVPGRSDTAVPMFPSANRMLGEPGQLFVPVLTAVLAFASNA